MLRSFFQKYSKQVIVLSLVATLVFPNIASAQLVTTDPVVTGWTTAKFISDKAYQTIVPVLQNAATVAVVNVSQQVARDAAESVATWITSGGKGQNPLQYMKSPTDYIKSAGAQGLGDFLGNYSQALGLGDFLCHPTVGAIAVPTGLLDLFSPPDININANIDLGLPPAITVQPKCDFQSVLDSYDALGTSVSQTSDQLLGSIGDIAKKGGEIDSVMADQMQAFTKMQISASQTAATLAASPSHAPVVSPISGDILRPGSLVAIEASANTAKAQQEKETQTMSGLLASGASAIPSIFASTLFNSLSKKIMERLFSGKGDVPSSEEKLGLNLANAFGAGGRAVANGTASTNIFTSTKTATVSEGDWDQLTVFSSCPTEFAQADNCVIEQGFASAIRNAQTGNALTVKDALANGTLHGDWELVPPSQVAQNEDPNCYKSSYCYSNLVKLRKARIIPIGWEIAAANSDGNGKVTLGLVASKFNDCAYVKNVPTRDPQHPYCHLIDPDWVLKMPQSVCRAKVYGRVPESSQGASRQQECADETSCLQEDSTGQCTGAYGYCMRERNTFTFDAPSCPAQFAGCRTFSNKQSGEVNLIESTVDS